MVCITGTPVACTLGTAAAQGPAWAFGHALPVRLEERIWGHEAVATAPAELYPSCGD